MPIRMAKAQKQRISIAGKDVKQEELSSLLMGMWKCTAATLEDSLGVFHKT